MSTPVAVVFTGKPIDTIVAQGGSASWRAVPHRARQCQYVLCTRNTRAKWSEGPEDHGSLFAIGHVSGVTDAPYNENDDPAKPRYLFQFDRYAIPDFKDPRHQKFWKGHHWPVHYTTLEDTGISLDGLTWIPMLEATTPSATGPAEHAAEADNLDDGLVPPDSGKHRPLTIAEAKHGLSLTFGVPVDAVEITIKG